MVFNRLLGATDDEYFPLNASIDLWIDCVDVEGEKGVAFQVGLRYIENAFPAGLCDLYRAAICLGRMNYPLESIDQRSRLTMGYL